MQPGLLLIDLQQDFLDRPGLEPPADILVGAAGTLLAHCRAHGVPVFHAITRISADGSDRMPHWQRQQLWECVAGSAGALPPPSLAPETGEPVFDKPFFSAFGDPALLPALHAAGVDTLVLAGVYSHACVRGTALDAYQAGFQVMIASDAVGSCDPEHGRISLAYLDGRAARCIPVGEIVDALRLPASGNSDAAAWTQRNPCNWQERIAQVPLCDAAAVDAAFDVVRRAQRQSVPLAERRERLARWLSALQGQKTALVDLLIREVAKPRQDAEAEFDFACALLQHTLERLADVDAAETAAFEVHYRPRGVVGLITPWNNPLAIPVGKLAPALGYGNGVIWKPALQAPALSRLLIDTLGAAGMNDCIRLVTGGAETGRALAGKAGLAALSFTGSVPVGRRIALSCAATGCELQAELGGNNGVIVLADTDPERVAGELARAVFSFSGQRCTAPRRIIVEDALYSAFEAALVAATKRLPIGHPGDAATHVGPVISRARQQQLFQLAHAAVEAGGRLLCGGKEPAAWTGGCWMEPTLVAEPPLDDPIVRDESFGPVAVLLRARDFDHAIALCNHGGYGLMSGLFSNDTVKQQAFLDRAETGTLLINQARPAFDADAPFNGWKSSGIGLPEHGRWDRDFYTRTQTRYR